MSLPHAIVDLPLILPEFSGFGGGIPGRTHRPDPRSYDDYFKAYSVAMLPGKERENVSYGGKSA